MGFSLVKQLLIELANVELEFVRKHIELIIEGLLQALYVFQMDFFGILEGLQLGLLQLLPLFICSSLFLLHFILQLRNYVVVLVLDGLQRIILLEHADFICHGVLHVGELPLILRFSLV